MIDYLFISPLGWSRHIWDKITTDKRFSNKSFEIVEFLNDSFEDISEELISKCISDNLNKLSPEGVVITSSFGTIALISTLINSNISMNRLILIDGFDIIPSSEELNNIFSDVKDGYYQQLSDYYDSILSDNEKEDLELLNILNYNLTVENDVYTPKLDIKSTVSYLSIYSNRDIEKSFLSISDKVSSFSIFSKLPISIPHTVIREENHLLMLKEPKELLGAIFQSD